MKGGKPFHFFFFLSEVLFGRYLLELEFYIAIIKDSTGKFLVKTSAKLGRTRTATVAPVAVLGQNLPSLVGIGLSDLKSNWIMKLEEGET